MEESISREAGADAGEFTSVEEIESLIRSMGRTPRQRTTLYGELGSVESCAGLAREPVVEHLGA
jgi:FO synthase